MIWISIAGTEVRVRLRPSVRARRVGSLAQSASPGARSPEPGSGPAGPRGIDGRGPWHALMRAEPLEVVAVTRAGSGYHMCTR